MVIAAAFLVVFLGLLACKCPYKIPRFILSLLSIYFAVVGVILAYNLYG